MTNLTRSTLIFSLMALGSLALPATASEVSLYCHVPTTVFHVTTSADGVVTSTVTHPYGIQFTPLYKGTVVASQAVQLNEKASVIQTFGPSQSFTWPLDKCRILRPLVFSCSQGQPVEINGQTVNPISLVTSLNTHELADYTYQTLNVNLTLRVGSRIYNLTSDYQASKNCSQTRSANAN